MIPDRDRTYFPPPCTQQWPDPPTADLLQESTEHLFPPPWPAQKFLSLAPLLHPTTVHLRPPLKMCKNRFKKIKN